MITNAAAASRTLDDVNDLIWNRCQWFVKRYGGLLEDARSEANEAFIVAYLKWDADSKMSFTSYVYQVVTHRLLELARNYAKRTTRCSYGDDLDTVAGLTNHFQNRLLELSPDAFFLFRWVSLYSDDILASRQALPATQQQRIIEFFCNLGWERERVVTCLDELEYLIRS